MSIQAHILKYVYPKPDVQVPTVTYLKSNWVKMCANYTLPCFDKRRPWPPKRDLRTQILGSKDYLCDVMHLIPPNVATKHRRIYLS